MQMPSFFFGGASGRAEKRSEPFFATCKV